jgi:hypothetical protein
MSENGKSEHRRVTMSISFDYDTSTVTVEGPPELKLGMAQMMLDEAGRQMEEKRREAAIGLIQQKMAEQKRLSDLAASVQGSAGFRA